MSRRGKVDTDSVAPVQPKRIVFDLEFPCNALATHSNGSLLAAVGRKLFKVLKISPDHFETMLNLRDLPPKQMNLNFSSNDVQWNPKDDNQLATAPTNGSVVLWDISKRTKSKLTYVFEGFHQRAVNKLSFHPRDPHVLLSGSQDNCMRIFDTRQKCAVATYKGPDCVRDVKFSTLSAHDTYFAACFDNGVLQIWDCRHGDNPVRQMSVHNGPAYCCTWHPEQENWIMSAGRDKMIKVFDIQQVRVKDTATVHALFSVARAKWRPGHKFHITSCSHFLDNVVALWDFRRPYIPFASFTEHTDDITDFVWLNDQVLVSCSKDGKLIQQLLSQADRPAERTTPVGLSFSPDGRLAQACSEYSLTHKSKVHHSSHYGYLRQSGNPIGFRRTEEDPYQDAFLLHTSSLREFTATKTGDVDVEVDSFRACASSYKLHGLPVPELCDHNYQVARSLDKLDKAQTWLMLKLLYCGSDPECSTLGLIQTKSAVSRSTTGSRLSNVQPPSAVTVEGTSEPNTPSITGKESAGEDSVREDEGEEAEDNNAADVSADLDFFEDDEKDSDVGPPHSVPRQQQQEWSELPAEPFQLRQDIVQRPPSPDHEATSGVSTGQSAAEITLSSKPHLHASADGLNTLLKQSSQSKPQWDFHPVVANMLKFYAEQGDVQMSVSVLLVLGEKAAGLIDEPMQEQWFSSYIDLLMNLQLWSVAALVVKLCPVAKIGEQNLQSTAYHTGCGNCGKMMDKKGWQCQRCERIASICSLCHSTVRGMYAWCQGCGHGGHLHHIQAWYNKNSLCPAGCGHVCVY